MKRLIATALIAGGTLAGSVSIGNAATFSLVDWGSETYDPNAGLAWLDLTLTTDRSYNTVSGQLGAGGEFEGYRYASDTEVSTLFTNAGITNPYNSPTRNAEAPLYSSLIDLLGATYVVPSVGKYTYGFTGTWNPLGPGACGGASAGDPVPDLSGCLWLAHLQITEGDATGQYADTHFGTAKPSDHVPQIGSWLVRSVPLPPGCGPSGGVPPKCDPYLNPVPLPAGVWLLLSALGGLGFAGWRRKRVAA